MSQLNNHSLDAINRIIDEHKHQQNSASQKQVKPSPTPDQILTAFADAASRISRRILTLSESPIPDIPTLQRRRSFPTQIPYRCSSFRDFGPPRHLRP